MDDLRIALLIGAVVFVAGIYVVARLARRDRRDAARRGRVRHGASSGPRPGPDEDAETSVGVHRLEGFFAPRRETPGTELSVDVGVLAGLRASYESTVGLGEDEPSVSRSPGGAGPDPDDADPEETAPEGTDPEGAGPDDGKPGDAGQLRVDMTRPLVYLTLVAKEGRLSGSVILEALDAEDFRPGLMQLYYRCSDMDASAVVGVANMAEPGTLDPDALHGMESRGLVTFMSVPKDMARALRTLNLMLAVSKRLANRLGAMLCDETRSTFTAQTETHLRETVGDILRRDRLEG